MYFKVSKKKHLLCEISPIKSVIFFYIAHYWIIIMNLLICKLQFNVGLSRLRSFEILSGGLIYKNVHIYKVTICFICKILICKAGGEM